MMITARRLAPNRDNEATGRLAGRWWIQACIDGFRFTRYMKHPKGWVW